MAGKSTAIGNASTLNLMLGIFLKLLGFFVVLYGYTEVDHDKARQVQESINQRFNMAINFVPEIAGTSPDENAPAMQTMGRSYQSIADGMKTQIDFLSTEYDVLSNILVLRVPAQIAMDMDGQIARSPNFVDLFVKTVTDQRAPNTVFNIEAIIYGKSSQSNDLMRDISLFSQKILARGYAPERVTIGYQSSESNPVLELRIEQVAR